MNCNEQRKYEIQTRFSRSRKSVEGTNSLTVLTKEEVLKYWKLFQYLTLVVMFLLLFLFVVTSVKLLVL